MRVAISFQARDRYAVVKTDVSNTSTVVENKVNKLAVFTDWKEH